MGGRVGPFFYIGKRIVSDTVGWEEAEVYGKFRTWGSHADFWDRMSKKDARLGLDEYFEYPRGRVNYDAVEDKFHIYLCPVLNNEKILGMIIKQFELNDMQYLVDDTDEHYQLIGIE
jgi:hypothetical protein